tara:strand:- start:92 stop:682 length:591 start_codon:yes stop_codon:yes gene_type:complete
MSEVHTEYLFPTPMWWADLDLDNRELETHCYQLKEECSDGRIYSNRGGYQSTDLPYNTPLNNLLDSILDVTNLIFRDTYALKDSNHRTFISNYWININGKNHWNVKHIHPKSFLSGVYYVKAKNNPEQGNIEFHRSEQESFILNGFPIKVSDYMSFPPMEGRLMVFPSYLPHAVTTNNLDNDRISISFNIILSEDD